ncbi:ribose 5-phosphate isomerase A-domain-containing protein [Halteromyces radiatus]|uniref:ribose 5-phosphate isomerase A-domain-containing protein n=1 Tax=Halteromyces radiatus TaxID=101107 RepID=UPI002220E22A|nr:ribose 5-phosphate isomerase A-domain-containing protein [Halteromyces radiatus]KAI8079893.1 ribose 5-phosphate isomerase A-domain-containing protein [Halteromyces radiatus]
MAIALSHLPSSFPFSENSDDTTDLNTSKKRQLKPHVKTACINCKKAHLACDLSRPCKRCVSSGKSESCRDIQHKKRGRPKRTDKRQAMKAMLRQIPSSFIMTRPSTDREQFHSSTMTMFLSMELCCARVSDESLDFVGLYPQEFSHRSLYDFIVPKDIHLIARIHRSLLDNATFCEKGPLPSTQRTTADFFTSFLPYQLSTIANGSMTLKQSLVFKTSDPYRYQRLQARFYLGGGTGADLFNPTSLQHLYIVCVLAKPEEEEDDPTIPTSPQEQISLRDVHLVSPTMMENQSLSPLNSLLNDHQSTDTMMTPDTLDTWTKSSSSPIKSSNDDDDDNVHRQERRNGMKSSSHIQTSHTMVTHPYQAYYQTMLSSRLSSEAQAFASSSTESNLSSISKTAYKAVDDHISPDDKVIGIGSGSTVVYVVERILQKPELRHLIYIPTSFQSKLLIIEGGLNLGSIEQYPVIDVTIDGADEVDPQLNAIKGGGACQFQEKVVAEAAKKFIIVADYRKKSSHLGVEWTKGVPIEVVPMAYKMVMRQLETKLSLKPIESKLRMAINKAGPVVTDNGNFVIDTHFGPIHDPSKLLQEIKLLTGVYEVGLFCQMAQVAYFGENDGSVSTLEAN